MVQQLDRQELRAPSSQLSPKEDAAISGIVHEFLFYAGKVATASLAIAMFGTSADIQTLINVSEELPSTPTVFGAVRAGLIEVPARSFPAISGLSLTYHELDALSERTITAANDMRKNGASQDKIAATAVALSKDWRKLCNDFLTTISLLETRGLIKSARLAEAFKCKFDETSLLRTKHALLAASNGELPRETDYITQTTEKNDWLQKRQWQRKAAQIPCLITMKGQSVRAVIKNLSAGGALIEGLGMALKGAPISIILPNQRIIKGAIAWSASQAVGVRFEDQLSIVDELLVS